MSHIVKPQSGESIKFENGSMQVPNFPIIPFIEGDGIGIDITPVMKDVVEAAVAKAYGDSKKIHWMEVYAGEKANKLYGGDTWLPEETLDAIKTYHVGIKGPLTTPVGGGIRSLNVALRQQLDLFVCMRPVSYFEGTPAPVRHPERVDMVIFRENSEDIYAGIEFDFKSEEAKTLIKYLQNELTKKIRFPETSGVGVKAAEEEQALVDKRLIMPLLSCDMHLVHKNIEVY